MWTQQSRSKLESRPCHLEVWYLILFLNSFITLEKEAKKVEGFDMVQKPSYYVRLGSLSTKLRSRAYQQALTRVKEVKQKSQETISKLHSTVNLVSTTSFKDIWSDFMFTSRIGSKCNRESKNFNLNVMNNPIEKWTEYTDCSQKRKV